MMRAVTKSLTKSGHCRRWAVVLSFALLAVLTVWTGTILAADNVLRNFKIGEKLPGFTLDQLDGGGQQTFAPGKGKPAAILFFAVNPEFRRQRALALLAELGEIAEKHKGRAEFLALYSEPLSGDTVQEFVRKSHVRLPLLSDADRQVYEQYGVFMMPLVILVGKDGTLHEVVPYTYNIREIVDGNIRLLLGEMSREELLQSLEPADLTAVSKEEKEYIRRVNYGRVMMNRKMTAEALREFSTAIKLLPDLEEAHIEKGFAHLQREEWSEAEKSFREVLQRNKDSDDAVAGLGLALYGKGDAGGALAHLENAFIVPEPKLEVIIALANIYETKGNMDKAVRMNKLAVSRLMKMYELRWQQ